ncbi:MAG: sigma-70 family RNA polymerase sigma factor [Patescibacteria group bacterium]
MDRDDDFFLIERARRNKEEYGLLYIKYKDRMLGYFVRRVKERATAEDLTQEVFLRSFARLDDFQWMGHPYSAYLFAVARTVLARHFQGFRMYDALDEETVSDGSAAHDMAERLDVVHRSEAVWRASARLVQNRKVAFFLRYAKHMRVREISQNMRMSENAVKLALSRGRKQIAQSVRDNMTPFRSFAHYHKQRQQGRAVMISA